MTKRIFRAIFLVALAVFLASLSLIMGVLYSYYTQIQRQQLKSQTLLAAQAAAHEGMQYFSGLDIPNCRITWIDADGTVLYDNRSESAVMENHLEREEIREALESGYGESARTSTTLTESAFYSAKRLPDGTVLRLSMAQNSMLNLLLGIAQPICVVIAVALVLSALLASRVSRAVVEPLNKLDLDAPAPNSSYPELEPLLHRLEVQQRQLRTQAGDLLRKQNEFNAVTASMSEGLVLLNSSCQIVTLNPAARKILGISRRSIGTDILTYNKELGFQPLLLQALDGHRAEAMVSLPGGEYQVDASPVEHEGVITGVALLLFDVTEKLRSEQLRREFTANVSHELKTPLQSISGYAELMAGGLVRPEDVVPFAEKIQTEAQRMIRLVADILRLSQLDEGVGDMAFEPVDLYAKAAEAIRSLSIPEGITVSLEGETLWLQSIPDLLSGILTNLCSNAIKYNRPGGSVTIRVGRKDGSPFLCVEDTGIGIPKSHQSRIFERFYRVDKSRSKAVGGTGLGLSIVKHAVQILDGSVELISEPGQGTCVTVIFKKTSDIYAGK
ncbi:MAG: PAS domain-containing sensor histidine kinase [Oscillospiraceae bacterium]|nr:PAS domain-containing sensor histidine kinase [Oscillospiraceae bacterium]